MRKKPFDVHKYIPLILPSLTIAKTYFLFRANGEEVKFIIDNRGQLLALNYTLNSNEIARIKLYLINEIC